MISRQANWSLVYRSIVLPLFQNNPALTLLCTKIFNQVVVFRNVHFHETHIFRSESKLLGLLGGDSCADCCRFDPSSAFCDLEFNATLWHDLKGVTDPAAVASLCAPDQNPSLF
jgi:hypothetical protein